MNLLAVDQGYSDAQCTLGVLYFRVEIVPENYFEAFVWRYVASLEDEFSSPSEIPKEYIEYNLLASEEIAAATASTFKLHKEIKKRK